MGKVCCAADFGVVGCYGEHTLVPLLIKIPGFWGKRNIPRDYRGMCHIPGGDEGIRTLDTVAGILHFQCSALDQLCDVSGSLFFYSASSAATEASCSSSAAPDGLSDKAFSSSASISRNRGSSVPTSNEPSSAATIGVSLYDCTNS